jgi:hypothetical protein
MQPPEAQRDAAWNEAVELAANLCEERYFQRAAQGFPREASTARGLTEAIRAMKREPK